MDLAEFLLARIAEDEAEARNASAAIGDGEWFGSPSALRRVFSVTMTEVARSAVPRHIARHDPARVLAECEAKRRIVGEHQTIRAAYPGTTIETDPCCLTCSAGGEYPGEFPCTTLRLLTAPYASHPDYRQEWAATVDA